MISLNSICFIIYILSDIETQEPQLYAAYHETYITEDAAKKFRHKMNSHKIPYTRKDYDDLLDDIILKPIHKPNTVVDIYDKKYFDYLPAEEMNVEAPSADTNEKRQSHDNAEHSIEIEEFLTDNNHNAEDNNNYDETEQEDEIIPDNNQYLPDHFSNGNKFDNRRYKRDVQMDDGGKHDSETFISHEKRHAGEYYMEINVPTYPYIPIFFSRLLYTLRA